MRDANVVKHPNNVKVKELGLSRKSGTSGEVLLVDLFVDGFR